MRNRAIILGGAGFIGSNVAEELLNNGYDITIIDGLVEETGGSFRNIEKLSDRVRFIHSRIEDVGDLDKIMAGSDLLVDSIAWTSHIAAIHNPRKDMELNLAAHLRLIECLPTKSDIRIIYLGSRGQFGSPKVPMIDDSTPMIPEDVQGIHKVAAESFFRVFSKLKGFNIISLRIPNCFGENQPTRGEDIGLVGSFLTEVLKGNTVKIFGKGRTRNLIYVKDLAGIIREIAGLKFEGFQTFNIRGQKVPLLQLAELIISICGQGSLSSVDMPQEIEAIDMGDAECDDSPLLKMIGTVEYTNLERSIAKTLDYFKERGYDLAL